MNRRNFLKVTGITFAAMFSQFGCKNNIVESKVRQPNILFLFADDMRADEMGCAGNKSIQTPNLDRLADQGAHLTNFYCAAPLCGPSRATMLTGGYPHQHGVLYNFTPICKDYPSLPKLLNAQGYKTAMCGKMGQVNTDKAHFDITPQLAGFSEVPAFLKGNRKNGVETAAIQVDDEDVEVPVDKIDSLFVDKGIDFINENKHSDQPWYLQVNFTLAHGPLIKDPRFDKYNYDKIEKLPLFPPAEKLPRIITSRYADISLLDYQIGRLMEQLEKLGIAENTLVFFTSDQGMMRMSHANHMGKNLWYEEVIKIPCLVSWKGKIPAGMKISQPANSVDYVPTILSVAGLEKPANLPGRNILPMLMGESMPPPEYIASEALHWQMIKEGNWKYVTHTVDSRELLYNLESDPYEYRDISQNPNYLDKLKHMRSLLKKWLNETPPFPNQRHPLTKEWYRGHINDWFKNGRHVNLDVWPDENGLAITSRKD